MPRLDVVVQCPLYDSFRVRQVAGMFDVPPQNTLEATFSVERPPLDDDWQVGLIVGPSGSGKSTVARHLFGDDVHTPGGWSPDRAIVDGFGDVPVRDVTALLTAVGFSSPPSWLKPHRVLSVGEQFRCDLAKALSRGIIVDETSSGAHPIVAFDEFTSVVDRNVARVGSAAVAASIRAGRVACRFVAVTCHYDVAAWLEPDWTLDMATGLIDRRRLRRPQLRLDVFRATTGAWELFKKHHYLTAELHRSASCFLALWGDVPVAFCATLPLQGRRGVRRISRLVTLPDFQGIGVGMKLAAAVAEIHCDEERRTRITASHPAVIGHCRHSPLWRCVNVKQARRGNRAHRGSQARAVVSFEYVGVGVRAVGI
ncbi:MAG: ABC transporter ATP-binding protein [Planctomycetales bacterium]|nr:ABC transporter ATP-binding protein [Planctomycetales bacterium]